MTNDPKAAGSSTASSALSRPVPEKKAKLSWIQKQLVQVCQVGGIPEHVAFVMDGNRRYARTHNLRNVLVGHERGYETLIQALEICLEFGVKIVTVYAFSEENFARPSHEVDGLMNLAAAKFKEFLDVEEVVMKEGVIVDMFGRAEILPPEVRRAAARVVVGTKNNEGRARLNVCFAYSGTEEIATAMRTVGRGLAVGALRPQDVDFDLISRCTYLGDLPAPDLLIRTSGETRLSDFLLWHLRSTKMIFLDALWPDLNFWHLLQSTLEWQVCDKKRGKAKIERGHNARVEAFIQQVNEEKLATWKRLAEEGKD